MGVTSSILLQSWKLLGQFWLLSVLDSLRLLFLWSNLTSSDSSLSWLQISELLIFPLICSFTISWSQWFRLANIWVLTHWKYPYKNSDDSPRFVDLLIIYKAISKACHFLYVMDFVVVRRCFSWRIRTTWPAFLNQTARLHLAPQLLVQFSRHLSIMENSG